MSRPLLLDEMLAGEIAVQLRRRGHDVLAAVLDPALVGRPDDEILAEAARAGRALVTVNIRDFMPLDARCRAAGRSHAGLVLVSPRTFPQDRSFPGAVVAALAKLLDDPGAIGPDRVVFLAR